MTIFAHKHGKYYLCVCVCVNYIDDDPLGEMLIAYSECQSSTFNSAED